VDHDEEEALILSLYPPVTTKRFPFERKWCLNWRPFFWNSSYKLPSFWNQSHFAVLVQVHPLILLRWCLSNISCIESVVWVWCYSHSSTVSSSSSSIYSLFKTTNFTLKSIFFQQKWWCVNPLLHLSCTSCLFRHWIREGVYIPCALSYSLFTQLNQEGSSSWRWTFCGFKVEMIESFLSHNDFDACVLSSSWEEKRLSKCIVCVSLNPLERRLKDGWRR
jgi:hypothetical protein